MNATIAPFYDHNINGIPSDGYFVNDMEGNTLVTIALENDIKEMGGDNFGFMKLSEGCCFNFNGVALAKEEDTIREDHKVFDLGDFKLAVVNGCDELGEKASRIVQVLVGGEIYSEII